MPFDISPEAACEAGLALLLRAKARCGQSLFTCVLVQRLLPFGRNRVPAHSLTIATTLALRLARRWRARRRACS